MAKNERPIGITILTILAWMGAVLAILSGIGSIIGGAFLGFLGMIYGGFGGLNIVSGIISIAFGVLAIFIGKGLWDGKNWARITALILSVLGILGSLTSLFSVSGIISLIIGGVIIWYLGFNEEAKNYFGASGFF